ncbi:uncharacterized protein [Amphiura filiformis]|uniref:uncharacterized protein n=1 Tax=Amphiura filiformis TaxID=82378 RepID=UPI003B217134
MAMEATEEPPDQRKITFLVWTGHYTVNKLSVKLYAKEKHKNFPSRNPFKTINCTLINADTGKIWEAETNIEQNEPFWYTYVVNDFPGEGSDCDHGGYGDQEKLYREPPPEISFCHDILRLQQSLHEDDLLQGFLYHLKLLLNRTNDQCNLRDILQEFEYLWGKEDRVFTEENAKHWSQLQQFLNSALEEHNTSMAKLLLLALIYGILLKWFSGNFAASRELVMLLLDQTLLINIRDAIITCSKNDVTPWSITYLLETGKEVLKRLKEYNWLYIVTYFPHLFTNVEQILLFKYQMGAKVDPVQFQQVMSITIPLIMSCFPESMHQVILEEIPNTPGFNPSAEELHQLHGEIDRYKATISTRGIQPDSLVGTAAGLQEVPAREEPKLNMNMQARTSAAVPGQPVMIETNEIQKGGSKSIQPEITFRLMAYLKGCAKINSAMIMYRYMTSTTRSVKYSRDYTEEMKLEKVQHMEGFIGATNAWYSAKLILPVPISMIDATIQYRYSISYQKEGRILMANYQSIDERQWRHVEPPKELFDVIQNYNDQQRTLTTCFGSFMHAYQRLYYINDSNLNSSLLKVSDMGVGDEIPEKFKNFFIRWMEETLGVKRPLSTSQTVYVAVLFGIVLRSGRTCIEHNSLSDHALQKLLRELQQCKCDDIPYSIRCGEVKAVCIWLTQSLGHSWFFLWSSFCHLFPVEDLMYFIPCKHYGPIFSTENVMHDMVHLISTLMTFVDDKPIYFQQCMIFAIRKINNLEVLVQVLEVVASDAFRPVVQDKTIVIELTNKIKEIMAPTFAVGLLPGRNATNNIFRMWKIVAKTEIPMVIAEVRQHVISYLSDEKWSPSDGQIYLLLLDNILFEKGHEFIRVMKNMLNIITTNLQPQEAFIDVISKQPFIHNLHVDEIKDLVERAVQSYTSVCRVHKPQKAIESAFRLQDNITRSFSDKEPILKKTKDRMYKLMKNVPLEQLCETLLAPDSTCPNWPESELQLLTDHISRRLHDSKKKHHRLYGQNCYTTL